MRIVKRKIVSVHYLYVKFIHNSKKQSNLFDKIESFSLIIITLVK